MYKKMYEKDGKKKVFIIIYLQTTLIYIEKQIHNIIKKIKKKIILKKKKKKIMNFNLNI